MANMAVSRVNPAEAAERLADAIREQLPSAGVKTRTLGDPQQRSLAGAWSHEMAGYFRSSEPGIFAVIADCNAPRPLRLACEYVEIGRGAAPVSITYQTRLRHLVPGGVAFRKGAFRSGTWEGQPALAAALANVPGLSAALWHLIQPKTVYGNIFLEIEAGAALLPDPDGAVFVVISTPARGRLNLGGPRPAVKDVLDLAGRIEEALPSMSGVTAAPTANAALPEG
jgi:hypothetical protein